MLLLQLDGAQFFSGRLTRGLPVPLRSVSTMVGEVGVGIVVVTLVVVGTSDMSTLFLTQTSGSVLWFPAGIFAKNCLVEC